MNGFHLTRLHESLVSRNIEEEKATSRTVFCLAQKTKTRDSEHEIHHHQDYCHNIQQKFCFKSHYVLSSKLI